MNKQMNASFKMVALVALLWFAAGCASASTPTPSTPSLVGTWVITVTEENALVSGGQKVGMGQYEVTFTDNGRVSNFMVGVGVVVEGGYTLAQDKIVFKDENSSCVKFGFPTATYKWSIENDSLTLTPIDDGCYIRRKSAEVGAWTRKKTFGTPVPTSPPMLW
jgi:hypothetical protein